MINNAYARTIILVKYVIFKTDGIIDANEYSEEYKKVQIGEEAEIFLNKFFEVVDYFFDNVSNLS